MPSAVKTAAADIELLTMTEAAELLKIKRRSLQKYWKVWGITAVKTGRFYKFRRSDLAAWLAANETKGNPW